MWILMFWTKTKQKYQQSPKKKICAPNLKSLKEKLAVAGIDLGGVFLRQATPVTYTKERRNSDLCNNELQFFKEIPGSQKLVNKRIESQ